MISTHISICNNMNQIILYSSISVRSSSLHKISKSYTVSRHASFPLKTCSYYVTKLLIPPSVYSTT